MPLIYYLRGFFIVYLLLKTVLDLDIPRRFSKKKTEIFIGPLKIANHLRRFLSSNHVNRCVNLRKCPVFNRIFFIFRLFVNNKKV